jgi:hypothetical protein
VFSGGLESKICYEKDTFSGGGIICTDIFKINGKDCSVGSATPSDLMSEWAASGVTTYSLSSVRNQLNSDDTCFTGQNDGVYQGCSSPSTRTAFTNGEFPSFVSDASD